MHPYASLDEKFFWSSAVAKRNMFDIAGLWDPKFRIGRSMQVATFGSCFAQHIGRALAADGFNWMLAEPTPAGLSEESARKFNYGVFSARTGNIYTVSLLKQWVDWATGAAQPPAEVWEKDGRFFDPFRPNIEPEGFESRDELVRSRQAAIDAFRAALTECSVFVFTLGLTESWVNKQHGYEYPMCPGTVAGEFDAAQHEFVNQDFPTIRKTLADTLRRVKELNPDVKFLLTVSPVPLTATMSGNHVLVATMESKSVLRAVAGMVARQLDFADYFPSYEIISSTPFRGTFFEANQRNVNHAGVEHVMRSFFACLGAKFPFDEAVAERPDRPNRAGRPNRPDRPDRPDRPNRADRPNRPEPANRPNRIGAQAPDRPNRPNRPDRPDTPERIARRLERQAARQAAGKTPASRDEVVCEEELLNAFAKTK